MDSVSKETRSRIMRSIRSKDTKLEKNLYSTLSSKGVKGLEVHPSDVYGKPDFVHRKAKIAVFVDGCFWHGCLEHCRMPHSNVKYWKQKIERNMKRDVFVSQRLEENGWSVLRIWEHSLSKENDLEEWSKKMLNLISERQVH